jgi:hypothetical protein
VLGVLTWIGGYYTLLVSRFYISCFKGQWFVKNSGFVNLLTKPLPFKTGYITSRD